MRKTLTTLAALAIAAAPLIGCGDSDLTGSNSGRVNVMLTDAPFPFSEVKSVNVFVVRIDGSIADQDAIGIADENDLTGWTTLVSPNTTIDLLTLRSGNTTSLGIATVPTGTYRAFRLIIDTDQSTVTLNDGTTVDVKWPSAAQTGIKVLLDQPFAVTDGTTDLLIDFDVGGSFVMRGNSIEQNGLLFKPVVRVTNTQAAATLSGTVRGDTETGPGIPGVTIEVLKSGTALEDTVSANVVRTGTTDASGNFTLAFVPLGTYEVRATPPADSPYQPGLLAGGVTISAITAVTDKVIVLTQQ
jgi:hypothetical protein